MPVRSYDPKQVILNVNGIPIGGYADGTFIDVERADDLFTKVNGADGETSRAKSNNFSGMITITLAQTSASNDILNGIATLDEQSNTGVIPILMTDLSGRSKMSAGFAWIRKKPNLTFSKEIENREWILDYSESQHDVAGNPDSGGGF